jgi:hypothetical protein
MKNKATFGGIFTCNIVRDGKVIESWKEHNIVVDEGLNYILDSALSGGSQITGYYVGIFGNNYSPSASDIQSSGTAGNNFSHSSKAGEITSAYDESTRSAWQEAGVSAKVITNSANKAVFTFNTGATVYGAFLTGGTGSSVKAASGSGHKLVAAAKFASSRSVIAADVLEVTYQLSAADA